MILPDGYYLGRDDEWNNINFRWAWILFVAEKSQIQKNA